MKSSIVHKYDENFKAEAIELANKLNNLTAAAKQLDIHINTLRKWVKEYKTSQNPYSQEKFQKDPLTTKKETDLEIPSLSTNQESLESRPQPNELEILYRKALEDLDKQKKENDLLRNNLEKAHGLIGKLYMEANRIE